MTTITIKIILEQICILQSVLNNGKQKVNFTRVICLKI